jgi:hypothetical protein
VDGGRDASCFSRHDRLLLNPSRFNEHRPAKLTKAQSIKVANRFGFRFLFYIFLSYDHR